MKDVLKIRFLPLLLLMASLGAHAQLPLAAQARVLDQKIIKAIEDGDYAAALFDERKKVHVPVPPPPQIQMANVYNALGDYRTAYMPLTGFLSVTPPDSPQYDTAVKRYVELQEQYAELEEAQKEAAEAERLRPGRVFRDCDVCPEMVVLPTGSFMMGSPPSEKGRFDNEGPVHQVNIAYSLAVGVYEVTRGEYGRFVSATGHSSGSSCWTNEGGRWEYRSGRNWQRPGFSQTDRDPVVCVNWEDARVYTRWLSNETGESYRLLSESEWEYAARAGTTTARYWGESESEQCRYANGSDQRAKGRYDWTGSVSCDDGYVHTAPAGGYAGNGYGLHDVMGNVFEWGQDCWNESYRGAPNDGRAWESGACSRRVLRGGSSYRGPRYLRSANRFRITAGLRGRGIGFRVARTLTR